MDSFIFKLYIEINYKKYGSNPKIYIAHTEVKKKQEK